MLYGKVTIPINNMSSMIWLLLSQSAKLITLVYLEVLQLRINLHVPITHYYMQ